MKNYFKVRELDADEKGILRSGYAIIETPNPPSSAMICLLAGYFNKPMADISIISRSEFKKDIKEAEDEIYRTANRNGSSNRYD